MFYLTSKEAPTNETTAVNHKLNLSLTFGFEVQTSASKFTFQSKNKDLKATSPMKSGRIRVQEKHVLFQHDNYETTTSKLAVETFQTAELSLK